MLTVKAKMIKEEMNELTRMFVNEFVMADTFNEVSPEEFLIMQKFVSLLNNSLELMAEEAEMLETIDQKLDALLVSK